MHQCPFCTCPTNLSLSRVRQTNRRSWRPTKSSIDTQSVAKGREREKGGVWGAASSSQQQDRARRAPNCSVLQCFKFLGALFSPYPPGYESITFIATIWVVNIGMETPNAFAISTSRTYRPFWGQGEEDVGALRPLATAFCGGCYRGTAATALVNTQLPPTKSSRSHLLYGQVEEAL